LLCSGIYHLFEENEYDKDEMIRILEYLDNRKLRASILTIVNYNPCKEALESIIKVLKESKNDFYSIRYLAVRAIQKIGDKSAIPFLKEIANDKNEHEKVRKAAEKAIEVLSK
jgi:HEAT repeat protein